MNGLIFGRRRQGKSTLSLALAISRKRTVVVFDPNCQFRSFPVVNTQQSLVEVLEGSSDAALTVIVWRPDPTDIDGSFSKLAAILHHWEEYALVIDEASELQRSQGMNSALAMFLRQHPDSVDVFQSTHRVVDVHPLSRSLATDWYFLQTTQEQDLDLIVKATEVEELREEIPRLNRFEVIHYWLGFGGTREWKKWTDPKVWFVQMAEEPKTENPTPEPAPADAPAPTAAPEVGPKEKDPVLQELRKIRRLMKQGQGEAKPRPEAAPVNNPPKVEPQPEPAPVAKQRHRTFLERAVKGR